jgi:hypothetical protein
MEKSKTDASKIEFKLAAKEPSAAPGPLCIVPDEGAGESGLSSRRHGKQAMLEDCTKEERSPIIVNMARARGNVCIRLLAVGVFLSLLTMPSK